MTDPVTRAVYDVLVDLHQPDEPGHSMTGDVAALRDDAERIAAAARRALVRDEPSQPQPSPEWASRFVLSNDTGYLALVHLDCGNDKPRLLGRFVEFAEAGDTLAGLVEAARRHRCDDKTNQAAAAGGPQ
ncbi:hypothetical protein [Nocardiopsis rhodophaea]|uniref:hypothetical protein n=1 Tax=Nocardiopsis rhodophaea TaxID=280238 RepID=UPI0031DBF322